MNTTDKEIIYTVTEKEYGENLANGLTDEETLKPGTYTVRRSRFINKKKTSKEKISLYVDSDILEYFRQRAEAPNTAPYQTQINNKLRRVSENDSWELASIENEILNNEDFLRALKEKLAII